MKWLLLLCYSSLVFGLLGCQLLAPPLPPVPEAKVRHDPKKITSELELAIKYGAIFASEYMQDAKETCAKYKQRYEQGDWRAGWVLALQVDKTSVQSCLKTNEAMLILATLETENKIHSDLRWFNQYHLQQLYLQQQQTKKIRYLKSSIRRYKKQVSELKEENEVQLKKLEALKAIETSINSD